MACNILFAHCANRPSRVLTDPFERKYNEESSPVCPFEPGNTIADFLKARRLVGRPHNRLSRRWWAGFTSKDYACRIWRNHIFLFSGNNISSRDHRRVSASGGTVYCVCPFMIQGFTFLYDLGTG